MNAVTQTATTALSTKVRRPRPFAANWDKVVALTVTKKVKRYSRLKVDLSMPRALLFVLKNAMFDHFNRGNKPTLKLIMASEYAEAVRAGVENCIDLAAIFGGNQVPFPDEDFADAQSRKLLVEIFSDPSAISADIPKTKTAYKLVFVGKDPQPAGQSQAAA